MPRVQGLTIIVAEGNEPRFCTALTLAVAQVALGGAARVYAHDAAVPLLVPADRLAADDDGLPDRTGLLAMAGEAGVVLIACQTGLARARLAMDALAPGVVAGGMVGLLAELGDDRLVFA